MPAPPPTHPDLACPVTDPATLTALYDNNASPRNQADLKALQARSAAAFASPTLVHRRVVLGEGESDWADLFRPAQGTGPWPALVFVHGGRWQLNTSRETAFWAQACGDVGLAFVGLNFPPLSAVGLPVQIGHVARGIEAVRNQAAALGLDAGALALSGHSSGAHLALAALLRHPPAVMPRALLLLGGLYDLAPLRLTAHQASLGFSADDAATCSPIQLLLARGAALTPRLPPTLVAVGAQETPEFIRQSRALRQVLMPHAAVQGLDVPGAAHFDAALAFNAPGPGAALRSFVTQALQEAAR